MPFFNAASHKCLMLTNVHRFHTFPVNLKIIFRFLQLLNKNKKNENGKITFL